MSGPCQNNVFPTEFTDRFNARHIRREEKAIGIVLVSSAAAPDIDTRIALIQALIPVALERVREEFPRGRGAARRCRPAQVPLPTYKRSIEELKESAGYPTTS